MYVRVLVFLSAVLVLSAAQLVEEEEKAIGDPCSHNGTCKRLSDCPDAEDRFQTDFESVEICGADPEDQTLVVCCEQKTAIHGNKENLRISQKKCEEYAEYVYSKEQSPVLAFKPQIIKHNECARISEPLIVGGTAAKLKEFPHMAQIGYGGKSRITWLCGGSLISERWILSAAHCTTIESDPATEAFPGVNPLLVSAKWARLGDLDTASSRDGARPEIVKIVQRVNHPEYNKDLVYNDIALYKLERDIALNPHIRPICLQVKDTIDQPAAIASGWGHTSWGGRQSNILRKVMLNLVAFSKCNKTYGENSDKKLPRGVEDSTMLCAGNREGRDTCQGDSGGPLQIPLRNPYCMYAVIGVTSFGRGCAEGDPGLYTRVSHYVPWIESVVWPGQ